MCIRDRFMAKLLNLGREKCLETYSRHFKNATAKQIEYFYSFVSSGCIGLLRQWLEEGMVRSAQEIGRTAEKIMSCGIGYLESPEK